jgi:hypothetical protein
MKPLIAALTVFPSAALAHPGDHRLGEFLHVVTEPDHLAMIGLVVTFLAYAVYKLRARQ